jgi:hypothetical protein
MATIPLLDRTAPDRSTLVDQEQLGNLPLDGRNFLELALLASGTAPAPEGSAASVRGDFAFSASGGREDFNNYILDGVYNVDPKLNTPAVRPPVDGIQEFKVATSTYDASFGRNAAGQVNVVTRSGSNTLTGTAYEFVRSGAWNGAELLRSRRVNRLPPTAATSSADPSAARLRGTARSSSPTTSTPACAKASRASATCRRRRSGPEISRSPCSPVRSIRRPASRSQAAGFPAFSRARSARPSRPSIRCRTATRRLPTSSPRR